MAVGIAECIMIGQSGAWIFRHAGKTPFIGMSFDLLLNIQPSLPNEITQELCYPGSGKNP